MIRFASVVLFSDDVPLLRDFYRDLFDLPIVLELDGLVTFACGLSIWEAADARTMIYGGLDPSPVERPRCELYFETDAIEAFAAELEGRARLVHPVQTAPWAQRVIRFYDPDGHLVEVGEAMDTVARRLAADGLSPDEVAARTLMPPAFVAAALETGAKMENETHERDR
jgi:catechol 2,3-dioxygenase-like lactoylglutathione lyase family enzyme